MPVISNQPWPEGHPLKRGLIISGPKRQNSTAPQSTSEEYSGIPPQAEPAALPQTKQIPGKQGVAVNNSDE